MIFLTVRVVGFRFNAFCQAKRSQRKQESTGATPQALQRIQKKVISVWGFSVAALCMQLTPSIRYRSIASPLWILPLKKTPKSCARQESAKSDAGRGAASGIAAVCTQRRLRSIIGLCPSVLLQF